jgi:hypothetical protein
VELLGILGIIVELLELHGIIGIPLGLLHDEKFQLFPPRDSHF